LRRVELETGRVVDAVRLPDDVFGCVGGEVFANVWLSSRIARIDPASGEVTALIDTGDLLQQDGVGDVHGADVLNGIAYVPERDRFLLTGKFWPHVARSRWRMASR
jgi:glutaminyl-peptide cyclotransferase